MNQRIKELWVKALRSGRYKQGTRRLKSVSEEAGPRYCCLGVLCELAFDGELTPTPGVPHGSGFFDGYDGYPPESVQAWAGISQNPRVRLNEALPVLSGLDLVALTEYAEVQLPGDDKVFSLATANDHIGLSFEGIAAIIEGAMLYPSHWDASNATGGS